LDVAALYYLRSLTVQPVPHPFDGLQIATLCHLNQFSGDGTQVAQIIAVADFHPQPIRERLLLVR
jgi:hypothetical protein